MQTLTGPARAKRGRPPVGYFTKRSAEDWLRATLDEARRGTLPGMTRTGVRVSQAAAGWLRYSEHDRAVKNSTLTEYRLTADRIVRSLGDVPIEDVTPAMLERWKATLDTKPSRTATLLGCAGPMTDKPCLHRAGAATALDRSGSEVCSRASGEWGCAATRGPRLAFTSA